jgi:hypothetical protein
MTDSSDGSRAHPDWGKRTAPNQRLKPTGAAIRVFRASAFLQAAPALQAARSCRPLAEAARARHAEVVGRR